MPSPLPLLLHNCYILCATFTCLSLLRPAMISDMITHHLHGTIPCACLLALASSHCVLARTTVKRPPTPEPHIYSTINSLTTHPIDPPPEGAALIEYMDVLGIEGSDLGRGLFDSMDEESPDLRLEVRERAAILRMRINKLIDLLKSDPKRLKFKS